MMSNWRDYCISPEYPHCPDCPHGTAIQSDNYTDRKTDKWVCDLETGAKNGRRRRMTGEEVVNICRRYDSCEYCPLEKSRACRQIIEEMNEGTPETIFDILNGEYGGSEE